MRDVIPAGWCCLWESHPFDVPAIGVPCVKVDGVELCEACAEKHDAEQAAAPTAKGAA